MAGQAYKTHARQGRGQGNGYNQNWMNSPLWDSIDKKQEAKEAKESNEKSEVSSNEKEDQSNKSLDEMSLKERQKAMFSMVY